MSRFLKVIGLFALLSCQDKVICPAFQSTYILDDSTRNAYFSYVWQLDESTRSQFLAQQETDASVEEDTTIAVVAQPKTDYYAYAGEKVVPWRVQKKTKFGIIKNTWYPIKNYRLRTAPMENVLGPEPVSNEFVQEDFVDSLTADSLTTSDSDSLSLIASETKEKTQKYLYGYDPADNFNVEQLYYNKYYSYKFIDDSPEPAQPLAGEGLSPSGTDTLTTKKPFFKRLFNKKKTEESADSDIIEEQEESTEEADPFGNGE